MNMKEYIEVTYATGEKRTAWYYPGRITAEEVVERYARMYLCPCCKKVVRK